MSSPARKKLIEVALPLEAINRESAREKSIRHGHPSTLHLWWARRPLAACRAVLFASLVDDPSSHPEQFPTEEAQERERQRLFRIIEDLVKWENSKNELVLERARAEIRKSCGGNPPPVLDPFCGGGSIPLEAQRLGLEAYASDLNPVAVLITKALIEIPPKFANRPPVHPTKDKNLLETEWHGARGLAEDVRHYGQWIRDKAERRIGHLYPKVKLPREHGGGEATVIAWLWARSVKCPNPACGAWMPLVRSFWLSTKKGKKAWIEPVIDVYTKAIKFQVRTGVVAESFTKSIESGTAFINNRGKKGKATFRCIICNIGVANGQYIDTEANQEQMGVMPLALVAAGVRSRVYLTVDVVQTRKEAEPINQLLSDPSICERLPIAPARGTFASNAQGRAYGFKTFAHYFTPRQLVALTILSTLITEVRERVLADAMAAGLSSDGIPLNDGGTGALAYADAVTSYLGLGVSKLADYNSSLVVWSQGRDQAKSTFARQALPMVWDFAEVNPFAGAAGDLAVTLAGMCEAIESIPSLRVAGHVRQGDASADRLQPMSCIFTDPPYYDNVEYADLSDFFYVWLRKSLDKLFPDLFSTLLTPKAQELVAAPYRFGNDAERARRFFEEGLGKAFAFIREAQHPDYPFAVYYAFKQSEQDEDDEGDGNSPILFASTGWETMLEGLLKAGCIIAGTWPIRTERSSRSVSIGTNSLASSIVLICRPRHELAPLATRREFIAALKKELPSALKKLQHGNIAPVDLAQAAIGPGMAVVSRYAKVLEADGIPMRVRTALALINQVQDEVLAEQDVVSDADTRWAVAWSSSWADEWPLWLHAEILSKAKNTAVDGMVKAGILAARAGKVRLLRRDEIPEDWDPTTDRRIAVWEVTQHLIRALEQRGETGAAALVEKLGELGKVPVTWPIGCMVFASARSGCRKHWPIIAWSSPGRR